MKKICLLIRTTVTLSRAKYIARNQVKLTNKPDTCSLQNCIKTMREVIDLKFSDISFNDVPLNWNPKYEFSNKNIYHHQLSCFSPEMQS